MAYDETLAKRVRAILVRRKGIEEKKMFGGVGFLLHGNMLVGVWKELLIVRLGPDQAEDALLEAHVKRFDITGKPMSGWVMVASPRVEDDTDLKVWIKKAQRFVGKLPRRHVSTE